MGAIAQRGRNLIGTIETLGSRGRGNTRSDIRAAIDLDSDRSFIDARIIINDSPSNGRRCRCNSSRSRRISDCNSRLDFLFDFEFQIITKGGVCVSHGCTVTSIICCCYAYRIVMSVIIIVRRLIWSRDCSFIRTTGLIICQVIFLTIDRSFNSLNSHVSLLNL